MGIKDMFKPKKSLEELEDEEELWEKKVSIKEKQAIYKELEKRGENPKHFPNLGAMISWIKNH
jgi:hypothetical protein